ncbi:MAG: hypothetical protein ACR2QX_13975 [Woeseiaceae bacterium]
MKIKHFIYISIVGSMSLFAANASADSTMWGIYGEHDKHDCPVNNRETAKEVIAISKTDLAPLMEKYGVTNIVDMYHSGLEHTLVWVVETSRPHELEEFTIELGVARWNNLKFVPERTFADVIRDVTAIHGLQEWEPGDE